MVKKLLLFIPILFFLFLVQSYFWVPSYDDQTRATPDRLTEYITSSIGDASLLNPILSSDTASSQIERHIFEGLLDRDRDLSLRPRIAKTWEISEEVFFYVPHPNPKQVLTQLENARRQPDQYPSAAETLSHITQIDLIPAQKTIYTLSDHQRIQITEPPQIRIRLNKVVPNIFEDLTPILGQNPFARFSIKPYVTYLNGNETPEAKTFIEEKLAQPKHQPILTFTLRNDVYFHDGHPVTSKDVLFTYQSIMNPKNLSPRVADYEPVLSVTTPDSYTVQVRYKRLYSPAVESWMMGILPEHLLNKKALQKEAVSLGRDPNQFSMRDSRFNKSPIGCGPFIFEEWKSDQMLSLKRFDRYWDSPPHYKRYIVRIIPDTVAQEMEFVAGTLDDYWVQPHQLSRFQKNNDYQIFSGLGYGYEFIGYNMRRAPFDDPVVRRALGMAIDVNQILDYVLFGQGKRTSGPFLQQTPYYNKAVLEMPYNPEEALQLLKGAGWGKNKNGILEKNGVPLSFTLLTNSGNDLRKSIMTIVQESWRKIGIDVRTDLIEWSVFVQERINKLDFDAIVLGWSMTIEPDLFQIWHSSQTHPGQLNMVGYNNSKADDLIVKIRHGYDTNRKIQYCHELHKIIAQDQPYTFLYAKQWTVALDNRIVIYRQDENQNWRIHKITPTKAGFYNFDFNEWIKLDTAPVFSSQ